MVDSLEKILQYKKKLKLKKNFEDCFDLLEFFESLNENFESEKMTAFQEKISMIKDL
jgi:hypothetical protein